MNFSIAVACALANAIIMFIGGICDYRQRKIPNTVPLLLLITGIADYKTAIFRLVCAIVMLLALWLLIKILGGSMPGGDLKLLGALAFSSGLAVILAVIVIVGVLSVITGAAKRKNGHIPLCTYAAPAYMGICAVALKNYVCFGLLLFAFVLCLIFIKPLKNEEDYYEENN